MFRNHLFYTLKPILPRPLQLFLRRRIAQYQLKKSSHIWPIDPAAGTPPENWCGWPQNKTFAFVLTHDVDTLRGYNNVLRLAELEENMGFRSAFNFVPERYGEISMDLINELKTRGFGVAVHGLKHDGKLFRSKAIFQKRAPLINAYIKKWDIRGFTSPSMHHNLKWLAALDIEYSISTFDTDPFEPQPDGLQTIFPQWVPNTSPQRGFVELPYTMAQDFTLFSILQQKDIRTWKGKLDWIVEKGGMALLNTHSDYMDFNGSGSRKNQYPVSLYASLLEYVKTRHHDQYWHTTPINIARFWRKAMAKTQIP